jgi:hypothetical protein
MAPLQLRPGDASSEIPPHGDGTARPVLDVSAEIEWRLTRSLPIGRRTPHPFPWLLQFRGSVRCTQKINSRPAIGEDWPAAQSFINFIGKRREILSRFPPKWYRFILRGVAVWNDRDRTLPNGARRSRALDPINLISRANREFSETLCDLRARWPLDLATEPVAPSASS